MLRFLLAATLVILFLTTVGLILLGVEGVIGKVNKKRKDTSSLHIIQAMFRIILKVSGVKMNVIGQDRIPKDTAVLYVSNHRSYFDIVSGYTLVPGLTGFIAKKEMEKIPLLSQWMKNLYCLFLDRENLKAGLKTILEAISYVKSGISIWICPEGTRNHGETMLPFKEGSFKIAEKSGCPIVPVAFFKTDDIYENHHPAIRMTEVTIQFGEPIDVASMSKEEKKALSHLVQGKIQEMYGEAAAKAAEEAAGI